MTFIVGVACAAALIPWRSIAGAQTAGTASRVEKAPAGNLQNGKRVLEGRACDKCHGSEGRGMPQEDAAPRIAPNRLSLAAFVRFIRSPAGQMPAYSSQDVSDSDLTDVYAYLQSLAPPMPAEMLSAANAQRGERLYATDGCYECHNGQGQGSTQTGGSRIAPVQIPFSAFVSYVRQPSGQMPPYAAKTISNAELADIYVYLKSRPESSGARNIPLLNQ